MSSLYCRYTAWTAVYLKCTLHGTAGTLHFGLGHTQLETLIPIKPIDFQMAAVYHPDKRVWLDKAAIYPPVASEYTTQLIPMTRSLFSIPMGTPLFSKPMDGQNPLLFQSDAFEQFWKTKQIWMILTPGRSVGLISKVIHGQGQLLTDNFSQPGHDGWLPVPQDTSSPRQLVPRTKSTATEPET